MDKVLSFARLEEQNNPWQYAETRSIYETLKNKDGDAMNCLETSASRTLR